MQSARSEIDSLAENACKAFSFACNANFLLGKPCDAYLDAVEAFISAGAEIERVRDHECVLRDQTRFMRLHRALATPFPDGSLRDASIGHNPFINGYAEDYRAWIQLAMRFAVVKMEFTDYFDDECARCLIRALDAGLYLRKLALVHPAFTRPTSEALIRALGRLDCLRAFRVWSWRVDGDEEPAESLLRVAERNPWTRKCTVEMHYCPADGPLWKHLALLRRTWTVRVEYAPLQSCSVYAAGGIFELEIELRRAVA